MKEFKKTYCIINKENGKDKILLLNYAKDSTVVLRLVYNSIGNTYMGLMVESFISSIRGLIRIVPNFFEVMCDLSDYKRDLPEMGFALREATDTEILIFKN